MVGKVIQYDGNVGKICWSGEGLMFNFTREYVIGEIQQGDKVSFRSNGLLGEQTQAVDIQKAT